MSSQSVPNVAVNALDPSTSITEENSRREQPADFTCWPVFKPAHKCGTNFKPVMVPSRELQVQQLPQRPLELFQLFVPYFLVTKWVEYTNKWVESLLRNPDLGPAAQMEACHRRRGIYLACDPFYIGIHAEIRVRDHWKTSRPGQERPDHSIIKYMTYDRFQLIQRHLRLFEPFNITNAAAKANLAKVFAAANE